MLTAYRTVLSRPGAIWFSAAGLVGRLPLSMAGLAILLLVQSDTGSYGVGGAVSATYLAANAVLALPFGRLVDARGQGRVLSVAALVFGCAMVVMAVTVRADLPMATTYAAAAVAGGTLPPLMPASAPGGRTSSTPPTRLRPPTRSRPSSTRRSS